MVEFRLLGPVELVVDGRPVDVGGRRAVAVLAVLLIDRNVLVSADRLVEAVWGEEPPATAVSALQGHVSRLRRVVGRVGIETVGSGYLLHVAPGSTDSDVFERLVARARSEPPAAAATTLREALALWRGDPFAEVRDELFAQGEVARLEGLRLAALEDRIEVDLALGRHAELIGELRGLVVVHPFRERMRGQLMTALYRSGRQAEALEVYRATRQTLLEELGIDPSPALQRLEVAILNQDPALEWCPPAPLVDAGVPGVEAWEGLETPPGDSVLPVVGPAVSSEGSRAEPSGVAGSRSGVGLDERRVVTVLACGLRGRAGALDPEDLYGSLRPVQELVARVVGGFGGTLEEVAAHSMVARFGVPVAHEDDAERAVRAGVGHPGRPGGRGGGVADGGGAGRCRHRHGVVPCCGGGFGSEVHHRFGAGCGGGAAAGCLAGFVGG